MQVKRMLRATGVVVVASLSYGTAAYADSVIVGTVVSAEDKKPVADVVVTATSPNLQGEQVVVTDAQGQYRIPQLPPGVYTLRFDKESFRPFSRPDIQLRLDRTIRVNVELLPESFTETIEVTARPPTIDVGSTNTGVSVDQEFIKRIAVNRPTGRGGASRGFESLAELAPGAQSDQYGVSINGATSPENGYVVDGLSTNDAAFGINASPLSVEFVQDVNIITGGYMPEYGRSTGGVVNAVTKSGSNEFHGTVFANWTPGALEGTREAIRSSGSVITGQSSLLNLGDLGATLGGPILKDKLWFFAGVAPSATRWKHLRTLNAFTGVDAEGNPTTTLIPGSERTFFADQRSVQAMGKLTYLINQDHNLSLSVNTSPTTSGGNGRLTINRLTGGVASRIDANPAATGLAEVNTNSTATGLKYAGSFMDKKLLLDANLGWFHQTASTLPIDGSGDQLGTPEGDREILSGNGLAGRSRLTYQFPRSLLTVEDVPGAATPEYCGVTLKEQLERCPVQTYDAGGFGGLSKTLIDRYQANVKATYLANFFGQHVIKAGADTEMLVYDQTKAISGGVSFQEVELNSAGDIGWSDFRRYGYQTGPDSPVNLASLHTKSSSITVGGFVQDSWSIANRVTINAGLRYDVQSLYGGENLAFVLGNQWSPRVGVIVDPLGNGQMKVYANYARYYEQVPLNLVDRQFPGESRYNTNRVAANAAGEGCDPSTLEGQRGGCADPKYIYASAESNRNPSRLYTGGKLENLSVDPDIVPQSNSEYLVGAEYELLANTRLGAMYTHRAMNSVIEDMSRDDGATYFLGNPGSGFAKEFPVPERTYNAVTVMLTRAFSEGWLAQASYTWSRLYGNYPGLFRPETGQLDPNILSDFDLISLLDNRTGLLPYDRTHSVKVFGAKEFNFTKDFSGSLGLSYRGSSGTPINYLGGHVDYGEGEGFVLPRGSGGRTPWVNNIDTNIGLNYRVTKTSTVSFTLDVFNLFNFQTATLVDENYTYKAVLPVVDGTTSDVPGKAVVVTDDGERPMTQDDVNPNFKKATQYQSPRQVRFGIRYTF
ncbi:TonB-dependent receptor [Archangium minus]|uniref:TonB-dependent receptor n=1 Tax=Archangium minus TaxID=83450 RepID=A0ABY9X3F0_9BACT|nr:TonB-dependent receptor [Archangium minus]